MPADNLVSRQHDAIAMAIRPWQRRVTHKRALTNLGAKHTPLQAGCPVPYLPRFDQRFIAASRWPGFPLSSGSVARSGRWWAMPCLALPPRLRLSCQLSPPGAIIPLPCPDPAIELGEIDHLISRSAAVCECDSHRRVDQVTKLDGPSYGLCFSGSMTKPCRPIV